MLSLKKKVLEIEFEGKVYSLSLPTVSQIEKMQEKMKKDGENLEAVFVMLEELGLPRLVIKEMQIDHVNEIVEHLTDSKKN